MAIESSFKNMVLALFVVCLICSSLLAGVYAITKRPIDDAAIAKKAEAIMQVVPEFDNEPIEVAIELGGKTYSYYKLTKESEVVAYAIRSSAIGFGGPIEIMVGVTIDGIIYNTVVLSQAETPGLGAKCSEPFFTDQFRNFNPAERKLAVANDGGEIDGITASTITSRAYINAVNIALDVFKEVLKTRDLDEINE